MNVAKKITGRTLGGFIYKGYKVCHRVQKDNNTFMFITHPCGKITYSNLGPVRPSQSCGLRDIDELLKGE